MDLLRLVEPECAALPYDALHTNRPPVRLDGELAKGEPESTRVLGALPGRFDLPEFLENLLVKLQRNAGPRVVDGHPYSCVAALYRNADAAGSRGELDGVADEVGDHAADHARIDHRPQPLGTLLELQRHAPGRRADAGAGVGRAD